MFSGKSAAGTRLVLTRGRGSRCWRALDSPCCCTGWSGGGAAGTPRCRTALHSWTSPRDSTVANSRPRRARNSRRKTAWSSALGRSSPGTPPAACHAEISPVMRQGIKQMRWLFFGVGNFVVNPPAVGSILSTQLFGWIQLQYVIELSQFMFAFCGQRGFFFFCFFILFCFFTPLIALQATRTSLSRMSFPSKKTHVIGTLQVNRNTWGQISQEDSETSCGGRFPRNTSQA